MTENMRKSVYVKEQRKFIKFKSERFKQKQDRIKKLTHRNKKGDYKWKLVKPVECLGVVY